MSLRSVAAVAGLATALSIPSLAEAAYTTASVNVRTGPGTGYPVITTAPPGAWVGVHRCLPYWCEITFAGTVGWMSSGYIDQRGPRYQRPVPPPVYYPPPPPPAYYPPPRPYYRRYPTPYPYPYPRQPRGYYGFSFGFVR